MKDRPLVVCFSGRIGSGKSSVTRTLASQFGWRRAAFGDYLRDRLFREGGDPADRQALQDLGQRLVDKNPELFCREVLAHAGHVQGESLLVDGIRHVEIYRIIVSMAEPVPCCLVHLSASDDQVRERVETRSLGAKDLVRAEGHRVEAEIVAGLPAVANVILDGDQAFDVVVEAARAAIAGFDTRRPTQFVV